LGDSGELYFAPNPPQLHFFYLFSLASIGKAFRGEFVLERDLLNGLEGAGGGSDLLQNPISRALLGRPTPLTSARTKEKKKEEEGEGEANF